MERNFQAFDTETHLFGPGNMAPRLVCMSRAWDDMASVLDREEARWRFEVMLRDPSIILVGHNVSYDLAVFASNWPELLPLIFRALDENRITCTLIRQKLIDIGTGVYQTVKHSRGYTLLSLAEFHGYPHKLEKELWRTGYDKLDGKPLEEWPAGAIEYSLHDAKATQWVCLSQEAPQFEKYLIDEFAQTRAQFALHLVSVWGIVTDEKQVERYYLATQKALDDARVLLEKEGLVYRDKKGVWHKKAKLAQARMLTAWPDCPKTPTGNPKLDADNCEQSLDPVLIAYANWGEATSGNSHAEELAQPIIHSRFDSLLVSGRTSSSGPNIQNRSKEVGDRECFVPRPGCVFLDLDYDGLELKTVAQVLLNLGFKSRLAEAIVSNLDAHCIVAAEILRVAYEEMVRRKKDPHDKQAFLARQSGKIANFGLAGGLGWRALQKQARALYGVVLSDQEARALIKSWHAAWPEFKEYFSWVNQQCGGGNAWITQHYSGRIRGNCSYTEACNTLFQGLGADVAKAGLWALTKACWLDKSSVLYGSRIVNFVHDQFIVETKEERVKEKCLEMERVVLQASNVFLPDVPATGTAMPCRRWSKLVELVRDKEGNPTYEPWEWDGVM